MAGASSGANVCAALSVACELGPPPRVVKMPRDRAERHFSARLFETASSIPPR
jgi:cysteine synthase